MMSTYSDDLFGKLTFDVFWEGEANVPSLGGAISLEIACINRSRPNDIQRRLFSKFMAVCDDKLVSRMKDILCEYFSGLGHQIDMNTVSDKIHNTLLFIPPAYDDPFLVIQWETEYDDEHGVQIVWREDSSLRVGIIGDDID